MNAEEKRLEESRTRSQHWKRWGAYLSERAWGTVREDYSETGLPNLILDFKFAEMLNDNREDWREIVDRFSHSSVPVLCLSTSLAYFDAFRSEILPANLIQSQRDFFGAHTYQRIDKEGIFHTPDWNG